MITYWVYRRGEEFEFSVDRGLDFQLRETLASLEGILDLVKKDMVEDGPFVLYPNVSGTGTDFLEDLGAYNEQCRDLLPEDLEIVKDYNFPKSVEIR